jgi:hypothetical protein
MKRWTKFWAAVEAAASLPDSSMLSLRSKAIITSVGP